MGLSSWTDAGAERLFELNVIEKLLTLLEDPTNTHLFHDIYTTLHLLTDYANMNGEITVKPSFSFLIWSQVLETKFSKYYCSTKMP